MLRHSAPFSRGAGGSLLPPGGTHFNPFTFADIPTIAKHRHWVGPQPHLGNSYSGSAGGGHAHSGCMIYLGGSWPAKYRNQIFMNNIHGARLNQDQLEPKGSGYVGDRAPDFLLTNDQASQIVYFRSGPDGQLYMIDWYDLNQCHRTEREVHDASNGRVFRVVYNDAKPVVVDMATKSDKELVRISSTPMTGMSGRRADVAGTIRQRQADACGTRGIEENRSRSRG